MREFIAIDIPEAIKQEIISIQKKLPDFKGKLTEKENLHLTLKFLGEINREKEKEMRKLLSEIKIPSFETEIKEIGMFSDRIVWLHMTNCEKLQKEIDRKLAGLFDREDRFMSHLTIARIKSIKDRKKFSEEIKKIKVPEMKFKVSNFALKKSVLTKEKPVYEDIEKYKLEI